MGTRAFTFYGKLGKFSVGSKVASKIALPLACVDCVIDAIDATNSVINYYNTRRKRKFLELVYAEDIIRQKEFLEQVGKDEKEKITVAEKVVNERLANARRMFLIRQENIKKEFENREILLERTYEQMKMQETLTKTLRKETENIINIMNAILESVKADNNPDINTAQMEEAIRLLVVKYNKYIEFEIGG